jgi:1,4-dihydroxy-2-naphthoyl-CoA synthase
MATTLPKMAVTTPGVTTPKDTKETLVAYETLIVDQVGAIVTITLNRQEARNALDFTIRREMVAALDEVEASPAARVVILTGELPTSSIWTTPRASRRRDVRLRRAARVSAPTPALCGSLACP